MSNPSGKYSYQSKFKSCTLEFEGDNQVTYTAKDLNTSKKKKNYFFIY